MTTAMPKVVPKCCHNCSWYEWDYDEYHDILYRYCNLSLNFPTKKLTCKRQRRTK